MVADDTAAPSNRALLAGVPLIFLTGWVGGADSAARVPVGVVEIQRGLEAEADRLAVDAMSRAGYDPEALATYLLRVQPEDITGTEVLSPLSPRDERIAGIQAAIRELPPKTYPQPGGEFLRIQRIVGQR